MRVVLLMFGIAVGGAGFGTPAGAIEYPWCAHYAGEAGGTNCGFVSRLQCQATISGVGGVCENNPLYQPSAAAGYPGYRPYRHYYPRKHH
jgi:hypothetical protein